MIQLLFTIAFLEMFVALSLLFETPIRSLLILGLSRMKLGHGQLVAGTVAATFTVVFTSSLLGLISFQQRTSESGRMNPTDEVLMANRLLETSLMGFCLFLYVLIDRLHYNMRELLEHKGKQQPQQMTTQQLSQGKTSKLLMD